MRETRLPRLLSAAIGAGAVGLAVVAGFQLGTAPGGDGQASIASADRTPAPAADRPLRTPAPEPTLSPLKRPRKPYPRPSFPQPPRSSSAELARIGYQLEKVAWSSAGYVGDGTTTDCSVSDADLIQIGTYHFTCRVSFDHVTTRFAVKAQVKSDKVYWDYSARSLPVSERKATYEVTRQAFEPALATCSLVGLQPVRVGRKDGVTCWVTTVDNEQTTYRGELVPDGSLIFRQGH